MKARQRSANRQKLKRLQLIVHNRADSELPQVIDELTAAIKEIELQDGFREEKKGFDRLARGGRSREG